MDPDWPPPARPLHTLSTQHTGPLHLQRTVTSTPPDYLHLPWCRGPKDVRLVRPHAAWATATYCQKQCPASSLVLILTHAWAAGQVTSTTPTPAHPISCTRPMAPTPYSPRCGCCQIGASKGPRRGGKSCEWRLEKRLETKSSDHKRLENGWGRMEAGCRSRRRGGTIKYRPGRPNVQPTSPIGPSTAWQPSGHDVWLGARHPPRACAPRNRPE